MEDCRESLSRIAVQCAITVFDMKEVVTVIFGQSQELLRTFRVKTHTYAWMRRRKFNFKPSARFQYHPSESDREREEKIVHMGVLPIIIIVRDSWCVGGLVLNHPPARLC